MTKELDIQFLEISIRTWLNEMERIFYFVNDENNSDLSFDDFSHRDVVKEYKKQFDFLTHRVYNSCILYLEWKGASHYIKMFDDIYCELLKVQKANNSRLIDLKYGDIYNNNKSRVIEVFRQLLYPFRAFSGADEQHLTGLDYLENILESTTQILTSRGIIPSQESEVYNGVKMVIEATFSSSKVQYTNGFHPFYQLSKCYKPDILIAALNCAVEYKFATNENEMSRTIDEIKIDVQGYSGHIHYKLFYAVFYVKTGVTNKTRFKEIWDSKNFPSNWKYIFVEGSVKGKPIKSK